MNRHRYAIVPVSVIALATACGGNSPPAESPPTTSETTTTSAGNAASPSNTDTTSKGSDTLPNTSAGSLGGATNTLSPSGTGSNGTESTNSGQASGIPNSGLSDDQILQVTHVANLGEIEQARIAQQKANNARVKRFAAMMIKDHSDADSKGSDLAKKNNLSPSESSTSAMLKTDSDTSVQQLQQLPRGGSDFDRAYIDAQVKAHQSVLDTIDNKLLPNAKSPDVKSMLQTVRAKVDGHLKEAQDIQTSLARR